jgi:hypothetical protein
MRVVMQDDDEYIKKTKAHRMERRREAGLI